MSRRISFGREKAHPVPLMYARAMTKNEPARVEKERDTGKAIFKRDNPTERLVEAIYGLGLSLIKLSRTILIS